MKKIEKFIQDIIKYLLYCIIATVFVLFSFIFVKKIKQQPYIEKQNIIMQQWEDIKGINKNPNIKKFSICPSSCDKNNKFCQNGKEQIKQNFKIKGKIAGAYLYIEASVNSKYKLSPWDGIYFSITNKSTKQNKGGILILNDENLFETPYNENSVYLYSMNSISYIENLQSKTIKRNDNFIDLLKENEEFRVFANINSTKKKKELKELSVYYECEDDINSCFIENIN